MNIIEENNSEYKSELKLWENTDKKIWLEVGYFDPEDYTSTHGIVLTIEDAKALIIELNRLVEQLEPIEDVQPKSNPSGKQLTLTASSPSKVNWAGK